MLKPQQFANAFALATAILYLGLFLLKIVAKPFFNLILNSQFFGADIASQIPKIQLGTLLGALIAASVTAWIFGYLLAVSYNYFDKKK